MSIAEEIRGYVNDLCPTKNGKSEVARIKSLLNRMSDESIEAWTVMIKTEHLPASEVLGLTETATAKKKTTADMLYFLLKRGKTLSGRGRMDSLPYRTRQQAHDAYSDRVITAVRKSLEEFYRTLPIK